MKTKTIPLSKMTPPQQRVAIAQDVIAQLHLKRYKATIGTYVEADIKSKKLADSNTWGTNPVELDVKSVLQKDMRSCQVCAKGALFVAAVERFNNVTSEVFNQDQVLVNFNDSEPICERLSEYFSEEQLDLIEFVFEGGRMGSMRMEDAESDQVLAMQIFYAAYPKAMERMTAIMENIIANNGDFVLDASIFTVRAVTTPKRSTVKRKAKSRR